MILAESILAAVLLWVLAFFRNPERRPPQDEALLVAPADGTITDIETIPDPAAASPCHAERSEASGQRLQTASIPVPGPDSSLTLRMTNATEPQNTKSAGTLRIGIFLSIFSVHINRAPCRVTVEKIAYHKGRYVNAMNPLSSKVNESNDLTLRRVNDPKDCLLVRQVSGAIARRIVCAATTGQELAQGEAFGMIKFGSRTELHVPTDGRVECMVRIGDKVKAGETVLVRYLAK